MTRLALLLHRRARRVLLAALALFLLGAAIGGPVAAQLQAADDDFQDPASESIAAGQRLREARGGAVQPGVVALVGLGADLKQDAAARARLAAVARRLDADPGLRVLRVPRVGQDAALISRDGRQATVLAALEPGADELETVARLREELAGQDVRLGGPDVLGPEIGATVSEDLARAELLAFPILFLLSLWVFRSVVAALLPLMVGALSIVATFLVLRGVDSNVTALSVYALNLVTGIGLGLAIDWSLFIVSRHREEAAIHGYGAEALVRTLRTAGRTVLFSALTVAAAMAILLVFPLRFLYSMGIGGVAVTLIAAAVSLTVLPAVLAALGPRVNALSPRRWRRAADAAARPATQGGWYRLAHAVMRRPGPVAAVTALLLIVAGLPFLRIEFVAADHRMLPRSSEARQVADALATRFDSFATTPIDVVATAPPAQDAALAAYARRLRSIPGAGTVVAPQRLDARTALISVLPPGAPLSAANRDVVAAIRATPAPGPVAVGGAAAGFADQQASLRGRLPIALALLVASTFTLLFLMTGSVVLPVKQLLMNLLTLSATFGILVLIFQDGRLESLLGFASAGGVEATQPVLLFAVAFGLATDYGVILLSRIKEARDHGFGDREAIAFGVERTGRIVTAAALLFCVAIGAFVTSDVVFIKLVGLGTALAVAIDATIVRALLVPALMALLGRRNWWAPAPLRRLHDRFGLREEGSSTELASA